MSRSLPAIPQPEMSIESMYQTVTAMKEALEIITNQRGSGGSSTGKLDRKLPSVVTWNDLVTLGLIATDEVPT